ncbi:hypothetical protein [Chryseobacterium daeguense]|uniref:hypothetical protein n=1 Tax=Chryseobacterium daeguense TaxID=412438 RepID=UPI0003FFF340|nr:hypothetical protein [Chryseobacterium daeguense]
MGKILHNQTILDISIETTGSVDNCFQIAIANGHSVSADLTAGSSFGNAKGSKLNEDIVGYYSAKKIHPATGSTEISEVPQLGGIGYMKIAGNFKVS